MSGLRPVTLDTGEAEAGRELKNLRLVWNTEQVQGQLVPLTDSGSVLSEAGFSVCGVCMGEGWGEMGSRMQNHMKTCPQYISGI